MAKTVITDERHLTLRVPNDLPDREAEAVRQPLAGEDFLTRLRRALRDTIRVYPQLAVVRVSPTR